VARVDESNWKHRDVYVNGVRLHVVEAGSGPLVILLHGFPEYWRSWRHQIPTLVAAGFRVMAPDMRGYNLSAKPRGVKSYSIDLLSADVAALIGEAGVEKAIVAGHDWGGVVAWDVAMRYPDRVEKLIVLNAPHPAIMAREMKKPLQLWRSWYVFFFQLPWLPEMLWRSGQFAALRSVLRLEPVRRNAFNRRDVLGYIEAQAQPGALTATINYYRAAMRRAPGVLRRVRRIRIPTLLIWGERDRYLNPGFTHGLEKWVPDLHIERIDDASHFVQNDAPEQVNKLILEFLGSSDGTDPL